MNHQYRKRPLVIEAFQMTRERRHDNRDWPEWLNRAWNMGRTTPGALRKCSTDSYGLQIVTLEGPLTVSYGDWIIRGVQGELYPCKPEIFEATYEGLGPQDVEAE